MKKVSELIVKLNSQLTKKKKLFLTNIFICISNFYGFPKVHISEQIKYVILQKNNEYIELYEPNHLTVRPIVGEPICPIKPLSELIDIIFKMFFYPY